PDFTCPFILQTDASKDGLGAVLCQKDEEGREYVVSYASKSLLPRESEYSATELECYAVTWAIKLFRPYLVSGRFDVITDHNALRWLMETKSPSPRLAHWSLTLQEYDFGIHYRPGRVHSNVDTLSRDSFQMKSGIVLTIQTHDRIPQREEIANIQR